MSSRFRPEPLIESLEVRLDGLAEAKSRTFWERYLKGQVPFRGVPMAKIRKAVAAWHTEDGVIDLSVPNRKALAYRLFESSYGDDKLAGILCLAEHLSDALTYDDLDPMAQLFDDGHLADWNSVDWFCVKVLGPWLERRGRPLARRITQWKSAEILWRRRAANVAFVNLAPNGDDNFPGFTKLMLDTAKVTVRCPERFAQTGVGWLLRELAKADPEPVLAFTDAHLAKLSREGLKYIVEKMDKAVAAPLLDQHKATRRPHPP